MDHGTLSIKEYVRIELEHFCYFDLILFDMPYNRFAKLLQKSVFSCHLVQKKHTFLNNSLFGPTRTRIGL